MSTPQHIVETLGGRWNATTRSGRCRCPAHDDHEPSLDIVEKNGRTLFTCRAGCAQDAVLDGLRRDGLWAGGDDAGGGPVHAQLGKPTIEYRYHDADGVVIGAVCRWESDGRKEIRPATFDGRRWRWEAFKTPRPLYQLPELAAHRNKPVLVVEGEKAADAAREVVNGCVVMTLPGGTGAVGRVDLAPLKGRDVILWADNDEPGRKAMRALAGQLTGARSVKGVKLPEGLPAGWDLGDAIPADLDPVALVGRAVDVRADRLGELPIKTASAINATAYPEIRWAVPGLVPDGCTILAGPKSRGKSFVALDLALAVAAGGPALGNIACEPGAVLLLALEDSERRVRDRMRAILQGRPVPDALDIATEWRGVDDGGLADIEAWITARSEARLVIIDILAKVKGRPDRDRGVYDQDYATVGPFHALARARGMAIVLVHHTNKGAAADPVLRISGTMGLSGAADTTLVLSREAREMHGTLDVRGRDVPEREIALQFDPDTGCVIQLGAADDFRRSEQRRAVLRLLILNVDPMTPVEIAQALGKKRPTTRWLLAEMRKAGDIHRLPNGKYYATAT